MANPFIRLVEGYETGVCFITCFIHLVKLKFETSTVRKGYERYSVTLTVYR